MASISGGDKLEAYLKKLGESVSNGGKVRVGFLEKATYPSGKINVATVAAFNEFGTRHIPPRPFFRNMIRDKSDEWGPALARALKATDYDVEKSLRLIGDGIAGQLRQSIKDTNSPPLAESTIKRKGFAKPLVDTSHMLMSVDYEVTR